MNLLYTIGPIICLIITILVIIFRRFQATIPDRNTEYANTFCEYKDRRYRLEKDFSLAYYCHYEMRWKKCVIKKGVIVLKKDGKCVVPIVSGSAAPKEIIQKYGTRHQKRLVLEIEKTFLKETDEAYGANAKIAITGV